MFEKLQRSWQLAKISYGLLAKHKQLLLFPILSAIAALLITASFILPLWGFGTLDQTLEKIEQLTAQSNQATLYGVLFIFYFVNYLVVVYFNTALTACALSAVEGNSPTIGYGLSAANKRLPQVFMWAVMSATIGIALRMIENINEKAGQIVAAILGTAWTALTYFVIPVIVVEGLGPVQALKRSTSTLKTTWGESLTGGLSLGLLNLLVMVPLGLLLWLLWSVAAAAGSPVTLAMLAIFTVATVALALASSSAADVIFKALLYSHATGKQVPEDIDPEILNTAFVSR